MHDPSLIQNRCFLYHLIGNGTGEWRVPVGGMGAVTDALARAAVEAGAEIVTGAGVSAIRAGDDAGDRGHLARRHRRAHRHGRGSCWPNVAPWVLRILLGEPDDPRPSPRAPSSRSTSCSTGCPSCSPASTPRVAFAGTLHLGEDYTQLEAAYADAAAGRVPAPMPGEVYCHSLTDPSILGDWPRRARTR